MRLRRCAILLIEPRERTDFDLGLLLQGGNGLHTSIDQIALLPHIAGEDVLTPAEAAVAMAISPAAWLELDELATTHPRDVLEALTCKRVLVIEGSEIDAYDRRLRDTRWRAVAAAMHYASRWHGVDTEAVEREATEIVEGDALARLGPAPLHVHERSPAGERQPLAPVSTSPLDELLVHRVTCRNFCSESSLSLELFSAVMHRAWSARAVDEYAPGVKLLKKGVPSAGGLHPTEAYVLVQRVEGITPGLYHYHPVDHALESIRTLDPLETGALARRFVAAQAYFVDVPVMVIPTSRFRRNFWKYRNHAKAYRALILDVGHLSQTMYLAATEFGLAAFITAAINEVDIEQAFGLDPLEEGPLAVCGFGARAPKQREVEFDPLQVAWPPAPEEPQ
ncbi:MAG TPA: putative peptide maturation dehydrogenase [Dokdonella sp.]